MAEQIDVINPATGIVEDTVSRAEVHAEGHWHQVFHCLVIRREAGTIVFQRRSENKAAFPGKLDLSVTGHLSAGETPLDGVREAEEELGVRIDPTNLVKVGTRLLADDNGEGQNRELVHVFFMDDDRPLDAFNPPADEVSALIEIQADHLLEILGDPTLARPATVFTPAEGECGDEDEDEQAVVAKGTMRRDDLVEGSSGYWVTLAVMAKRFINGEQPLAI